MRPVWSNRSKHWGLTKIIARQDYEHKTFLATQAERGASCFSIIQSPNRIKKCFPLETAKLSNDPSSSDISAINQMMWVVKYLSPRNGRIWSKLSNYHWQGRSLCRQPLSSFNCKKSNPGCGSNLTSWFCKNPIDNENGCESTCKDIPAGEPFTKKPKLEGFYQTQAEFITKWSNPVIKAECTLLETDEFELKHEPITSDETCTKSDSE